MKSLVCAVSALALLAGSAARAGVVVVPAAYAAVEAPGNDTSPLGQDGESRFQQVFGTALLGGIAAGSQITGLTFRVNGPFFDSGVPAQTVTNYEIRLSTSQNAPGSMSSTFANNRGADEVIVRSGPLVIEAGDFPASPGDGVEPFGVMISFDVPFTYMGGNLLMEIAYTGFAQGRGADRVSNDASGQQMFTFGGAGKFGAATADYSERGVFVTAFELDGGSVPEPGTVMLTLAGLGLVAAGRARLR